MGEGGSMYALSTQHAHSATGTEVRCSRSARRADTGHRSATDSETPDRTENRSATDSETLARHWNPVPAEGLTLAGNGHLSADQKPAKCPLFVPESLRMTLNRSQEPPNE